ncbi:MAG: glycosyltransferase family 4 protein [Nitrospiraceae bacterium]
MRVVHLSTYDLKGGAALSAYRLHQGLLRIGQDSSMLVKSKVGQDPTVSEFVIPMDLPSRWRRWTRRKAIVRSATPYATSRPPGFELFSEDRTPYGAALLDQIPPCEVLNLHWVAAYLDYEQVIEAVSRRTVIVWTLHDMNALTGGCHYDLGCGRFAQRCGACPQLGSEDPDDLAGQVWDRKRTIFDRIDPKKLCLVTPSRWLGQVVKQSPIFARFRVETIPYGINLEYFAPRDRSAARDVLGIPQDVHVILFLAEMVDNRRKGFSLLQEALKECSRQVDRLWLLSVGHNPPRLPAEMRGSHLSYVGNDRFLSLAYSAADLFVIPSLQDNLPNTVLEAMACGIPVLGFDVGGIRDMVRPGLTGVLVDPGDIGGLRDAMAALLNEPAALHRMSRQARETALTDYPLLAQARRYEELYHELTG